MENRPSIGVEYQSALSKECETFFDEGLISHLQFTVPSAIDFRTATSSLVGRPTILHSNILNVFGANDWKLLSSVAAQIRVLRPLHVVEHLTALRPTELTKAGVYFPGRGENMASARRRALEAVERWRDLCGANVCLENIPIAEDVERYFDFVTTLSDSKKARIVCDVPHFIISCASAGFSEAEIRMWADVMNPIQVHVGGLSVSSGKILDNHRLLSPGVVQFARKYFPKAEFLTIEQGPKIPAKTLRRFLEKLDSCDFQELPVGEESMKGMSCREVNDDLAKNALSFLKSCKSIRTERNSSLTEYRSAFELFEQFGPFMFPMSTIEACAMNASKEDLLKWLTHSAVFALGYQSWWVPRAFNGATISCGEGKRKLWSKAIGKLGSEPASAGADEIENYRFQNQEGFWVEVAMPRIDGKLAAVPY